MQLFPSAVVFCVVQSVSVQKKYISFFSFFGGVRIGSPQGDAMLGNSLPVRNSKGLVRDVFDTFAKHSGLVHDVGDTRFRVQNVSTHGRVFTIFKRRFLTIRTRTTKYSGKTAVF